MIFPVPSEERVPAGVDIRLESCGTGQDRPRAVAFHVHHTIIHLTVQRAVQIDPMQKTKKKYRYRCKYKLKKHFFYLLCFPHRYTPARKYTDTVILQKTKTNDYRIDLLVHYMHYKTEREPDNSVSASAKKNHTNLKRSSLLAFLQISIQSFRHC